MKLVVAAPVGDGLRAVSAKTMVKGRKTHLIVVFEGRGVDAKVHAFVNECRHLPIPLDSLDGNVWDYSRRYLMCHTHGAVYDPHSGLCVTGPCRGRSLATVKVDVDEHGNAIVESDDVHSDDVHSDENE